MEPEFWDNLSPNLGEATPANLQQLVAEIPGAKTLLIPNKLSTPAARLWYLRATARFGWSRNVLLNQIKAGGYERAVTEKKTHNFDLALPEHFAEQADEMLKSSYNLEFLGLRRAVREHELEDRLITRLQSFLLELGYGFCFIGRQHRIATSNSARIARAIGGECAAPLERFGSECWTKMCNFHKLRSRPISYPEMSSNAF